MLRMVIEKPMQFTIVIAVPLSVSGAFCAIKVENSGESAITTIPQKSKKSTKIVSFATRKKSGAIKQQIQESKSIEKAVLLVPNLAAK